jgi:hypothetical protein
LKLNHIDKKYQLGNLLGKLIPKTNRSRAGFERLIEFGDADCSDDEIKFISHKKVVGSKPLKQLSNNRKFGMVSRPTNTSRSDNVYHRVYEHQKQVSDFDYKNWFRKLCAAERILMKLSL